MSTKPPGPARVEIGARANIAIIAARFNEQIVGELLRGCVEQLAALGFPNDQTEIFRVPGAFELPVAAKLAANSGKFSAIICLGAVIRGDTPHFEFVAGEAARGIQQVAIEQSIPVIFGVLTTNTEEQARQRIGGSHGHAGERAAEAAVEMIAVAREIAIAKG